MFGELFWASLLPAFLVTISIYVCLNFLGLADMTCDGSFSLGACAAVTLFHWGLPDTCGLMVVFVLGCLAGLLTAFMINKIRINPLLAGIISMTALESINYLVLERNTSVSFDNHLMAYSELYAVIIVTALLIALIYAVLRSEYGLILKVHASNPNVIKSIGLNSKNITYVAVIASNGIFAVAGALFIQSEPFVTPMIGGGTLVGGLIAVVIGENLIKHKTFFRGIIGCIIGTIIYKTMVECVTHERAFFLDKELQNLLTATLIIILFALRDFRLVSEKVYTRMIKK